MIAKTTRSLLLCSVAAFAGAAMTPQSAAAAQRALLIGIEEYENITGLEGPLEDARRMRQFLIQNMGFRSEDTVILSNGEATLEGLRAAFKRELIHGTRPGDRIVIYYSGHGGQVPDLDGDEEDGLDETLVSADGHADREDGHNHLTDDEFGALLAQLADRDVTVIIDACHSGTIARGENEALRDGGPTPRTPITVGARPSAAAIMAHRQEESFVVPPILFGGGEETTDMASASEQEPAPGAAPQTGPSEDDDDEDQQGLDQDQDQDRAQPGGQNQDQGQPQAGGQGQFQQSSPGGQNQGQAQADGQGQFQQGQPGDQNQGQAQADGQDQFQQGQPGNQNQGQAQADGQGQFQQSQPGGQNQGQAQAGGQDQFQQGQPGGQNQGQAQAGGQGQDQQGQPGGQNQGQAQAGGQGQDQQGQPGGQNQGQPQAGGQDQFQQGQPGGQNQGQAQAGGQGQDQQGQPGGQNQGQAQTGGQGQEGQPGGQIQGQTQAGGQNQGQGAASNGAPQPGQAEGFQPGSHRIWSAAAAFQYAWEQDGEGLFTKFLIEGAGADRRADANGNGVVSNAELIEYVRDKSENWCSDTQECADLSLGFTPTLEARGEDLAAAFVPIGQPVTDPTDVIVQGNIAGVAIEVLPGNHNRVGDQVAFRVSSKQPGWLILLDINAAGQITQLIPNDLMTVIGSSHEISGGRPVTIPAEGSRLVFTASPPTGEGTLIAIVTQDNVPLNELVRAGGDLSPQGDPQRYLAELARTLMEVWAGDDANRRLNWSMSTLRYTISQ